MAESNKPRKRLSVARCSRLGLRGLGLAVYRLSGLAVRLRCALRGHREIERGADVGEGWKETYYACVCGAAFHSEGVPHAT